MVIFLLLCTFQVNTEMGAVKKKKKKNHSTVHFLVELALYYSFKKYSYSLSSVSRLSKTIILCFLFFKVIPMKIDWNLWGKTGMLMLVHHTTWGYFPLKMLFHSWPFVCAGVFLLTSSGICVTHAKTSSYRAGSMFFPPLTVGVCFFISIACRVDWWLKC